MRQDWKAGDTCQIKPDSRHSIGKADCGRLWTVCEVDAKEASVHNGPPGTTDAAAPGLTIWGVVPLSCLLPAGDARPTVAAKMGAEVLRLRARVAELEAAMRWRVTAEELPPVGVEVFVRVGGGLPNVAALEESGGWSYPVTGTTGETAPDLWMPVPPVPHV